VSKQAQFWQWFMANRELIEMNMANPADVLNSINNQLMHVHPDIEFEIGKFPEFFEFVISAGGREEVITPVLDLYDAAPDPELLPGWVVTAFKPRAPEGWTIEFDGTKFDAHNVYYHGEPEGDRIHVIVYHAGLNDETYNYFLGATFTLLDSILGEYDVMSKLGRIELGVLPDDWQKYNLKPLVKLVNEVDVISARLIAMQ
jgi:hypothetical protein